MRRLPKDILVSSITAVTFGPGVSGSQDMLILPETQPTWWLVITLILTCMQLLVAASAIFFISAILSNKKVRNMSYNLYLVFLVFPDALLNLCSATIPIARLFSGPNKAMATLLTEIWMFYTAYYYMTNFWMNLIVAYEIHKLARLSYRRIKTKPPPLRVAWMQFACVNIVSILVGVWYALPVSWSPGHVDPDTYTFAFGSPEGGLFSTMGGTVMFLALIVLVPAIYVIYVRLDLCLRKLLPTTGRTRILSLYYLRIMLVFFAFYIPNVITAIIKARVTNANAWFLLHIVRGILESSQALVTLHMASKKSDVKKALNGCFSYLKRKKSKRRNTEASSSRLNDSSDNERKWNAEDRYKTSYSLKIDTMWRWNAVKKEAEVNPCNGDGCVEDAPKIERGQRLSLYSKIHKDGETGGGYIDGNMERIDQYSVMQQARDELSTDFCDDDLQEGSKTDTGRGDMIQEEPIQSSSESPRNNLEENTLLDEEAGKL